MLFLEDDYQHLGERIGALADDDSTDERYQLEDLRRNLVRQLDAATVNRAFQAALQTYEQQKYRTVSIVERDGDSEDQKQLTFLRRQESDILAEQNVEKLRNLTRDLEALDNAVLNKSPRELVNYFNRLGGFRPFYSDQRQAERYLAEGQDQIRREDWTGLKQSIAGLHGLLPEDMFRRQENFGTAFGDGGSGKVGF